MKNNIFIEELRRRGKVDDNAYSMIGTELKRVRTSQSQTLSSIAGDLCSVSYLCKVEKAQLKPNRFMLNEICKKLNVDSPKLDILFELKTFLNKIVDFFYEQKWNEIKATYEKCKMFDNYRTKLISFIYDLSLFKLEDANGVAKELFKIANVMNDDELSIFIIFYSKLKYYEESYEETLDNIKELSRSYPLENSLGKIASILCLECYVKMNSPITLLHANKLLDSFLKSSEFRMADYVRYLQAIYMLHNSMMDYVESEIEFIQTIEYKETIKFYYDYVNKTLKKKEAYQQIRPFASLLWVHVYEEKEYLDAFCQLNKNLFYDCDFSYNIASYFTLSDDEERYREINDVILLNISQTKNAIERLFFLKEFCRISTKYGKYKGFCRAYKELNGGNIE